VATDIVLLASSDIAELHEVADGAGGSSSMAHKRNPVAAVSARAAAAQAPGLVATVLHAAGGHELQRAAGAWHAEWPALQSLLRCTGAAVEWLAASVERLVVDPDRMASNLDAANIPQEARRP
jgi:3-carboxy-cis,cis-muconate cycloisomerase